MDTKKVLIPYSRAGLVADMIIMENSNNYNLVKLFVNEDSSIMYTGVPAFFGSDLQEPSPLAWMYLVKISSLQPSTSLSLCPLSHSKGLFPLFFRFQIRLEMLNYHSNCALLNFFFVEKWVFKRGLRFKGGGGRASQQTLSPSVAGWLSKTFYACFYCTLSSLKSWGTGFINV